MCVASSPLYADGSVTLSDLATSAINAFLGLDDQSAPRRLKYWLNQNVSSPGLNSSPGRSTRSWNLAHGESTAPVAAWANPRSVAIQENGGMVTAFAINVTGTDATNVALLATSIGTSNNQFNYDLFAIF
jgi:hypothetical protein